MIHVPQTKVSTGFQITLQFGLWHRWVGYSRLAGQGVTQDGVGRLADRCTAVQINLGAKSGIMVCFLLSLQTCFIYPRKKSRRIIRKFINQTDITEALRYQTLADSCHMPQASLDGSEAIPKASVYRATSAEKWHRVETLSWGGLEPS